MISHPVALLLTIGVVLVVVLISEVSWRKGWLKGEFVRKFAHITAGSFAAFWPFYLDWNEIRLLGLGAFVAIVLSKWLGLFSSVQSVRRLTYGEVFSALSLGLITLVTESKGIYATAILALSLADGLAAVVGTRYGRGNTYTVLGNKKSAAGTTAFFVVSLALLAAYSVLSGNILPAGWLLATALATTALENVMPYGLDDLAVPLFIGWALTGL